MPRRNQFLLHPCVCGKPAEFKALVSIYPLGSIKGKFMKSAKPIGICGTCMKKTPKTVNKKTVLALTSSFAEAVDKSMQVIAQQNESSRV